MRALILSAPFGSGHRQAAEATAAALTSLGVGTEIRDIYELADPTLARTVAYAWTGLLRTAPDIYRVLYDWTEQAESPAEHPVAGPWLLERFLGPALERLLHTFQPDVVAATHPAALSVAAWLKRKRSHRFRLVSIATDFAVHGFSVLPEIDLYCVPHVSLTAELECRGVTRSAAAVTGIPVASGLAKSVGRTAARLLLGLPPEGFIPVVMGGGQGLGAITAAVRALAGLPVPPLTVVLTGRNRHLVEELQRSGHPRLSVVPYTDRVDLFLEAADLLITKPGGLTLAEALVKNSALALLPPLPGQEERNHDFMTRYSAAYALPPHQLGLLVERLRWRPEQLLFIRERAAQLAVPGAALRVAHAICALPAEARTA